MVPIALPAHSPKLTSFPLIRMGGRFALSATTLMAWCMVRSVMDRWRRSMTVSIP